MMRRGKGFWAGIAALCAAAVFCACKTGNVDEAPGEPPDETTLYTIKLASISSGILQLVAPKKAQAAEGSIVTIRTIPNNSGYIATSLIIQNKPDIEAKQNEDKADEWSFPMPASDITVSAVFEKQERLYSIGIAEVAGGGTLRLLKPVSKLAAEGAVVTLITKASAGYCIASVYLQEKEDVEIKQTIGKANEWYFTMPPADVTAHAAFTDDIETDLGGSATPIEEPPEENEVEPAFPPISLILPGYSVESSGYLYDDQKTDGKGQSADPFRAFDNNLDTWITFEQHGTLQLTWTTGAKPVNRVQIVKKLNHNPNEKYNVYVLIDGETEWRLISEQANPLKADSASSYYATLNIEQTMITGVKVDVTKDGGIRPRICEIRALLVRNESQEAAY